MKNNYTYKEFMDKCMMIYKHNKIENVVIENQVIEDYFENEFLENIVIENQVIVEDVKKVVKQTRHIVKGNKLSSEDSIELNQYIYQNDKLDIYRVYQLASQ
jgi:zona occludens toxin (predicted ATPase)